LTINMFRAKEQSRQLRKHEKKLYARRVHRIENKLLISKSKKEQSRLLGKIKKFRRATSNWKRNKLKTVKGEG
jgi:hypothetical protein